MKTSNNTTQQHQCDQIGRFIAIWAPYQNPSVHLFVPKLLGNFKRVFHLLVKTALVILGDFL